MFDQGHMPRSNQVYEGIRYQQQKKLHIVLVFAVLRCPLMSTSPQEGIPHKHPLHLIAVCIFPIPICQKRP